MIAMNDERPRRKHGENWRQPDPGPLWIWAQCYKFQKGWSEEERMARRDGIAGGQPRQRRSPPRPGSATC